MTRSVPCLRTEQGCPRSDTRTPLPCLHGVTPAPHFPASTQVRYCRYYLLPFVPGLVCTAQFAVEQVVRQRARARAALHDAARASGSAGRRSWARSLSNPGASPTERASTRGSSAPRSRSRCCRWGVPAAHYRCNRAE
jgi:hypothetical protein